MVHQAGRWPQPLRLPPHIHAPVSSQGSQPKDSPAQSQRGRQTQPQAGRGGRAAGGSKSRNVGAGGTRAAVFSRACGCHAEQVHARTNILRLARQHVSQHRSAPLTERWQCTCSRSRRTVEMTSALRVGRPAGRGWVGTITVRVGTSGCSAHPTPTCNKEGTAAAVNAPCTSHASGTPWQLPASVPSVAALRLGCLPPWLQPSSPLQPALGRVAPLALRGPPRRRPGWGCPLLLLRLRCCWPAAAASGCPPWPAMLPHPLELRPASAGRREAAAAAVWQHQQPQAVRVGHAGEEMSVGGARHNSWRPVLYG